MMDQTLELRLKKLMLFRLVMVSTLLLIAAYVGAVSETLLAVNPLYFLIGATYFLTVFHALALRFLPALIPQVYTQVVGDLLVITGLVYVAGGVRGAGFMLLYPISVRSEEHTSELQSRPHLVCRLLLLKKKPLNSYKIFLS